MAKSTRLTLEATISANPERELTGKEWEITIVGPKKPDDLIVIEGEYYIRSLNGRLYSAKGLEASVSIWDGVKVYDNHLTDAEFKEKQGMRSPAREWLGTIKNPWWDAKEYKVKAIYKASDQPFVDKLKLAKENEILDSIGLSMDTYPIYGKSLTYEGRQYEVIKDFEKAYSVDSVGDPAAGGSFDRMIAAQNVVTQKESIMDEELKNQISAMITDAMSGIPSMVKTALAEAVQTPEEGETVQETEAKDPVTVTPAIVTPDPAITQATLEARLARSELMLERKLSAAKLPPAFEKAVREAFGGKVIDEKELDTMLKNVKEAHASADPTGRVTGAGGRLEVGLNEDDKHELELMRIIMGNGEFRELEQKRDDRVLERVQEARGYNAWVKAGKPALGAFGKISHLMYDWFGGDVLVDSRAYETATTSSLASVTKNTVNIMVAADYSQKEAWYEPIVTTEEVDTIDDATLVREYGVSTLSVVSEGGTYTELSMADEEETATFVKNGNYIGVTLETLLKDKVQAIRRIPRQLSNAWYNTLSAYVSGVFTTNTAAGPVLSDTGALFNATATTSAGGHLNLLTAQLSFTAFNAARSAMLKQTDQPLGAGSRLLIEPRFILVPVELETTALQIRNSEHLPGGADNDINPYYQKFDVIKVPLWTDTNNWALVGDPRQYPAIWNIFPRGQRTPFLATADSDTSGAMFTNDTMRFKIRMMSFQFSATYPVAPVGDFRPLHKSNV